MGKKLIVGVNDLKSVNPELAAEWNYEKNGKLLPEMISANSCKKVWWKGKCGHEWESRVGHRNNGIGCPYCSGQKVLKGFNDLQTLQPDLASEWHPTKNGDLTPSDIYAYSGKKIWWLGKCGHEWETKIGYRIRGTGCPYCSGQSVLKGFNDLESLNPELASEWNYERNGAIKPSDITIHSGMKVWWICSNRHEWEATVASRNNYRNGCPYCAGQKVIKTVNDLQTLRPDLASEWHPTKNGDLKPSDVMPNTNKRVWWFSKCGHEWLASPNSRVNSNSGCPFCNESHLEKIIRNLLCRYKYSFQEQIKFDGLVGIGGNLLSYDFGVYENGELDFLIECQGGQHYEPVDFYGGIEKYKIQLEHDRLKQEFCQKNHILLIEIPYTYSDEEIEAIFSR